MIRIGALIICTWDGPQRHRNIEKMERKRSISIASPLFLCASMTLWQSFCTKVAWFELASLAEPAANLSTNSVCKWKGDRDGAEKTVQKSTAISILVPVVFQCHAVFKRPNHMQQSNRYPGRLLLFVLEGYRISMHNFGLCWQLRCKLESGIREYGYRQRLEYRIVE